MSVSVVAGISPSVVLIDFFNGEFFRRYNDDDVDDDCELFAMVEDRTRKRIIIMEEEGEAAVA